jgi:predicted dehydrogenase
MSTPLRFGIIGCGLVSQWHGQSLKESPQAELVAAWDMVPEMAAKFVGKYGGEVAESFEAILGREDIDAVTVLTPNAYHEEYVVRAAEAGKHVLVEKPPELSLTKVDHMIAATEQAGVTFGVSLQVRFRQAMEALKAAVAGGRFGRLLEGDVYMKWYRPPDYYAPGTWRASRAHGAGVTIQQAFHYIDLLYYLVGRVARVECRMSNLRHTGVNLEDTTVALLEYESGAQGVVQASTALWPGTDIRVEINGERGTAIMQGERIATWQFEDEQPGDEAIRQIGRADQVTAAGDAAGLAHYEHMWLIEDFVEAVRTGRPPRVTGQEGRASLEIALAMYQSSDEKRPVTLPLAQDYVLR